MKTKLISLITSAVMLVAATSSVFAASAADPAGVAESPCWLNGTIWEENGSDMSYNSDTDSWIAGAEVNFLDAATREKKYSVTSDANGTYYAELEAGDYIIQYIVPEEYKYYYMTMTNNNSGYSDNADILGDRTAEFNFTATPAYQVSFESYLSKLSDPYLMGFVWYDSNANTIRPAFYEYEDSNSEGEDEVGIQGAVITVSNEKGEKVADGETNERGEYGFEIPVGVNTITVTLPPQFDGYGFSIPEGGTVTREFLEGEEMVDFGVIDPTKVTTTPSTRSTPAPSATATPDPSATATPEPEATATPEPEETASPEPEATPEPEDVPTLNKTEHYAYVVGYEDGNIKPENNITRQEVATIFFRLLTDASRDYFYANDNTFTDVSQSLWSNIAISTMAKAKIVNGYDAATFMPLNNITRAEFATIAAKFDSSTYLGADKFTDISGHWAAEYINRAAEKGWISGYTDGTFKPDAYITRAEAMTLINNVLERHVAAEGMLAEMTTWPDNTPDKWYYTPVQEATNSHYYEKGEDVNEIWTEMRETRNWKELER